MNKKPLIWAAPAVIALVIGVAVYRSPALAPAPAAQIEPKNSPPTMVTASPDTNLPRSEDDFKKILSPEAYHVMREQGTELPGSSPLDHEFRPGTYVSADCGEPLFRSEQKFDSGTGWPSFSAPIDPAAVKLVEDDSLPFAPRTEVVTSKCGSHLGHVFDDGPQPTGKRYCMNGVALRFIPDEPR